MSSIIDLACNLCGSDNQNTLYTITRFNPPFTMVKCSSCGLVYMSPRPSPEEIHGLYDDSYYSGTGEYTFIDERINSDANAVIHENRLAVLEKYVERDGKRRLLEVGCAFGGLLEVARKRRWETQGLEVSGYAAKYAKEDKGLNVSNVSVEEAELPDDFFDAAIMIEVVEHLHNPTKALIKINRSLKKGGIIMIQTANADSLKAKISGADWEYFLPGHLFCFSKNTLGQMLKKTGFEILRMYTGDELSVRSKIKKIRMDTTGSFPVLGIMKIASKHFIRKIPAGSFSIGGNVFIARKRDQDGAIHS